MNGISRKMVAKHGELVLATTGAALSVGSATSLCSTSCSQTHLYTLFGFSFAFFGLLFFAVLAGLLVLEKREPVAGRAYSFLLLGAVGGELAFIATQKFIIGAWCPLCLTIAAVVVAMACWRGRRLFLAKYPSFKTFIGSKDMLKWKFFASSLLAMAFVLLVFAGTLLGVTRTEDKRLTQIDPFFGDKRGGIELYIVTDWFCPGCRAVEPIVERVFEKHRESAHIAFIPAFIHEAGYNYFDYDIAFQAYEKEKYLKVRAALYALTDVTAEPTLEQVLAAVRPLQVNYKPVSLANKMKMIEFGKKLQAGYAVTSTPSIVVKNTKNQKFKVISGSKDISVEAVTAAIDEIAK